jgi:hypothetical protein
MEKIKTKHFQYTGLDDFDRGLDEQINEFLDAEGISANQLVSIKYSAHSVESTNIYTALAVYKTK